eukprot:m.19125 g.19125  ORF g.19125 m.19125 type:complete len:50 (-) comp8414_c1_seq1:466-615(-)
MHIYIQSVINYNTFFQTICVFLKLNYKDNQLSPHCHCHCHPHLFFFSED